MKKYIASLVTLTIFISASSQSINLRGHWKFHIGDDATWSQKNFNDNGWGTIYVPSSWEDEGFNGYDGFAWYRTKFDGRKLQKDQVYYLNLGFIDDADEVYLNGTLIGFSGSCPPKFKTAYNNERKYVLPLQLIDSNGDNIIAVRVFDGMHQGGIVDGDIGIFNVSEGAKFLIDLQGIWQFQISKRGEKITNESSWRKIMVPGAWEHQGYSKYDGFAWYKRVVDIPENFTREPVVLMLGKVDDFDIVYFNGVQIGSTNDQRGFGFSFSFDKTRVYEIPQNLIKRGKANVIEILVEDIGNIGGVYEGMIGITTKSNYERYFDK